MSNSVNILHLSDLHFGIESIMPSGAFKERMLSLEGLAKSLLRRKQKPNALVITGDIAYRGLICEFDEAERWLCGFINELNIPRNRIVICPGNHDINRSMLEYEEPQVSKDGNEYTVNVKNLRLEEDVHKLSSIGVDKYFSAFENYSNFCRKVGVREYYYCKERVNHYLYGTTKLRIKDINLRFIILNSAWNSRSGLIDKGNLLIGKEYLVDMRRVDGVQPINNNQNEIIITMFHHPKEWLSNKEIYTYAGVEPTYQLINNTSHIILNGHTHGEKSTPNRHGNSLTYVCGTALEKNVSHSSCTFLTIEKKRVRNTIYFTNAGSEDWNDSVNEIAYPLFSASSFFDADYSNVTFLAWNEQGGIIRNDFDGSRVLAIKDKTLNSIFNTIELYINKTNASSINAKELDQISKQLIETCGYNAGLSFGNELNVKHNKSSVNEKIRQWLEYDSSVGWGKCINNVKTAKNGDKSIDYYGNLTIHNSFQSIGNSESTPSKLCDFMRGYCMGVLEAITGNHIELKCTMSYQCRGDINSRVKMPCVLFVIERDADKETEINAIKEHKERIAT
jgi:Icc-related predicted phosphoesterase/predicted hydrocarbon binding protein